jgi:hypothetical protein
VDGIDNISLAGAIVSHKAVDARLEFDYLLREVLKVD